MTLEHLLPSAYTMALLSPEERIAKLYGDYWIGYGRATQALKKLEDLLHFPKRIRMPNMLFIGPTNNGKTMIVEKFRRQHLPYESEDRNHEIVPVLMVQMPSAPTIQRFYSAILTALGSPIVTYSSTTKSEAVALKLLKVTQVKILIIDEIHNLLAGRIDKQHEFLNVLRFLGNELQVSIVGVGIKDAYLAIRTDDQLENRYAIVGEFSKNTSITRTFKLTGSRYSHSSFNAKRRNDWRNCIYTNQSCLFGYPLRQRMH
jgi:Cdc6-like AAA superfamily ATPase